MCRLAVVDAHTPAATGDAAHGTRPASTLCVTGGR